MEDFNTSIKNINSSETVLSSKIYVAKSTNLQANVNGAIKTLVIKNLPLNYTAYTGIYGKELRNTENKKVYAKFYIKILDPFGREVSDFRSNYHLQDGLDIEFTSSNITDKNVKVSGIGVYEPVNGKYSLKVFNTEPIEIKEASQETKASNAAPSSSDSSTYWIIGGIVVGVILLLAIIWWFYGTGEKIVVEEVVFIPPKTRNRPKMLY